MAYESADRLQKVLAEEVLITPKTLKRLQIRDNTFLSSYTEGKKQNQFTKVQMNIEADRILLKYFSNTLQQLKAGSM